MSTYAWADITNICEMLHGSGACFSNQWALKCFIKLMFRCGCLENFSALIHFLPYHINYKIASNIVKHLSCWKVPQNENNANGQDDIAMNTIVWQYAAG